MNHPTHPEELEFAGLVMGRTLEAIDAHHAKLLAAMDAKDKQIEALRKDAERYRWLRARLPGSAYRIAGVIYSEGGSGVDMAIDAAMGTQPATTSGKLEPVVPADSKMIAAPAVVEPTPDMYNVRIAVLEAAEEACDNVQLGRPAFRAGTNACIVEIRRLIKKEVDAGMQRPPPAATKGAAL